ncbi:MAG TPA: VacJ family lipoprotein [Gemmatimonadales bacterium]|nr:VacJ family lipoprotein [Gemmatimonadales bacterium]
MGSVQDRIGRRCGAVLVCAALVAALGGCSAATRVTQVARAAGADAIAPAPSAYFEDDVRPLAFIESASPLMVAQATPPAPAAQAAPPAAAAPADDVEDIYDPWESFNEKMFDFNIKLDRYVLKPVARVWKTVIPEPFQVMISNGFDNIRFAPRFINNVLQGKVGGATREMSRFLINSTAGIGGLFDPAKDYWGIRPSSEDFGQTLGVWGSGPGPYLVLPALPPMTVRDGIGMGVDMLMDPFGYYVGFFPARFAMKVGDTINDRALNYDLFQGVEETTIDLYSSVRHFYLKRREQQIKE